MFFYDVCVMLEAEMEEGERTEGHSATIPTHTVSLAFPSQTTPPKTRTNFTRRARRDLAPPSASCTYWKWVFTPHKLWACVHWSSCGRGSVHGVWLCVCVRPLILPVVSTGIGRFDRSIDQQRRSRFKQP